MSRTEIFSGANYKLKRTDYLSKFQASGKWTGEQPHCEAFSTSGIIILTISAMTFIAIITTCIACCCLNIREIKVALFMKFNLSFGQRLEVHDRLHDVFVVYNHDSRNDESFVFGEIMPLLEKHHLSFVTEDCFNLGPDRFTSLQTILMESRTAVIIITRDLLRENWKLYQLNQAICTQIEQKNFKVVFLLCREPKRLGNLPQNLRLFLRVGSTVRRYKKNWRGNLIYELKH